MKTSANVEYMLTYRQALRAMYETDPSHLVPANRPAQVRFRKLVDDANTGSIDDTLYQLFGGQDGERDFAIRRLDAIFDRFGKIVR